MKGDLGDYTARLLGPLGASILEAISDGVTLVDEEGVIQYDNKAMLSMAGCPKENRLGQSFTSFVHNGDKDQLESWITTLWSHPEQIDTIQFRLKNNSERPFYCEANGSVYQTEYGKNVLLIVSRDISSLRTYKIKLERKQSREKLISEIAHTFMQCKQQEIPKVIQQVLENTGRFFKVDRAYMFDLNPEQTHISNTYEWCAEGISSEMEGQQNISVDDLPWWFAQMKKATPVVIEDVAALPEEASGEKANFEQQNIRSLLTSPYFVNGILKGFIGYDSVKNLRRWSSSEITFIGVLAKILGDGIDRVVREEKLEESIQRYRIAADFAPDWDYWINASGKYEFIGPGCYEISGYQPEAFFENPDLFISLLHPDDQHRWREYESSILNFQNEAKNENVFNLRLRSRSGTWKHLEHYSLSVFDQAGNFLGKRGVNRNITQRVTARQNEERLLATIQAGNEFFGMADAEGNVLYMNNAALELSGLSEAYKKRKLTIADVHPPEEVAFLRDHIFTDTTTRKHWQGELHVTDADGVKRILLQTIVMHRDEQGKLTYATTIGQDITELTWQVEKIKAQNQRFREISWLQSHVIRAPLARILTVLNGLEMFPNTTENRAEIVAIIRAAAQEMDQVIHEITEKTTDIDL